MSLKVETLDEARAYVRAGLDEGVQCPCCERLAKRYRRKLSSLMARWLIALVKASDGTEWVHSRDVFARIRGRGSNANDYSYLQHWGLIEPAKSDPEQDRREGRKPGRNGFWRPTPLGLQFANNEIRLSRTVVLYNNSVEGFEGEEVSIRSALGDHFDYDELMGRMRI